MALGKAENVTPLEAETDVNKFWVNNYATLVDVIKERLGEKDGRELAYTAYHQAVHNSCVPGWKEMADSNPDARDYTEWLITDLPQSYELEVVELTAESCRLRITNCPWATLFREKGREDTGMLFCEVDYDMVKDFNELTGANIVFERTKILMKGDDHCNHHIYVKKEE
ncbi:MAG: L-2-amino-thiazoline-4-carboxylic acid hydrolase [Chloroflexi bacterium]|nr:L-2-amino-thiazoline-4-carboxylic acid hydrolase [Chloroflexota bacterium]